MERREGNLGGLLQGEMTLVDCIDSDACILHCFPASSDGMRTTQFHAGRGASREDRSELSGRIGSVQ